ncbi:MAG: HAD family phosphatase [Brevinematales bacterium]|nr:HAD family phosphatase [Brevinematales bacterium]
MKNNIKLVIFDLGNVIFKIGSDRTFLFWSKLTSLDPSFLRENFFSFGDYDFYELGEVSEDRFRKGFNRKINFNISREDFVIGLNMMIVGLNDGIKEILESLSQKVFLAVLSNTNKTHEKYIFQNYTSILTNFDKLFLSHRIKCRKPEEKAYQTVLSYFKVNPSETIFFDDLIENVNAANQIGINSFLVKDNDIDFISEVLTSYKLK